jgi:hypothetical protein
MGWLLAVSDAPAPPPEGGSAVVIALLCLGLVLAVVVFKGRRRSR